MSCDDGTTIKNISHEESPVTVNEKELFYSENYKKRAKYHNNRTIVTIDLTLSDDDCLMNKNISPKKLPIPIKSKSVLDKVCKKKKSLNFF